MTVYSGFHEDIMGLVISIKNYCCESNSTLERLCDHLGARADSRCTEERSEYSAGQIFL